MMMTTTREVEVVVEDPNGRGANVELAPPGCTIDDVTNRGISLDQLEALEVEMDRRCVEERWASTDPAKQGERLTPATVTLYDLCALLIKPATRARNCAYVELVACGPQIPGWFISHWWGEFVKHFIACVRVHAQDHGLDGSAVYWVCAYANRQHDLGTEMGFTIDAHRLAVHARTGGGRLQGAVDRRPGGHVLHPRVVRTRGVRGVGGHVRGVHGRGMRRVRRRGLV